MIPDMTSPFIKYVLDDDEVINSHLLSELQIAGIRNELADAVSDLINIPLAVSDSSEEGRNKRAYTQGQVDAYLHILELHEFARAELSKELNQSQNIESQGE